MKPQALLVLMMSAGVASAGLLGVKISQPLITFQNTGTSAVSYTAASQLLAVDAAPTTVQFSAAENPVLVTGTRSLTIRAVVDNLGNLVGGVAGDDFALSGTVTRVVGGVTNTYSGVLLTGGVTGFGFLESGATDRHDFRFAVSGGALSSFYSSGDIGVEVTSAASTFTGVFSGNFNGRAGGKVGLEACPLSVLGWGYNSYGEATPPTNLTGVAAIAAGAFHSLALKSDGTVIGWGSDFYGETTPTNLTGVVAIAAGAYHNLALKSDGTVIGWGSDFYGESTPPTNLTGVVAVAAATFHSLALKSDGIVVGWGDNGDGEAPPPTNLTGVVAIAAGGYHSLALKSDGTVVGWGTDYYGESTPPTNLTGVVAIAAGGYHSLALKSDGTVVGWGYNYSGQATPPTNLTGVVAISAGSEHSLALNGAGMIVGWGYNYYGEATPAGLTAATTAIAAGGYHSLALTIAPSTPFAGTAIVVATNQVDVSWFDTSANEDAFKIQRAPDMGGAPGTWAQIATVGANLTNYSDLGVMTNMTYWYRVQSSSTCGASPYCDPIVVTIAPPPAPDSYSLTATVLATNQVDLSWSESTIGAAGYKIERAPDAGGSPGTWQQIATTATYPLFYSDTGLMTNTTYWYRVRAFNGLGDSDYSDPPAIAGPPAAPYFFPTSVGTNQVSLSWYDTCYPDCAVGYQIERAPDAGGSPGTWVQIATVDALYSPSYDDMAVVANATYWYRMRGYNGLGESPYTDPVSVGPPAAPSNLTAIAVATNQVNLSWFESPGSAAGIEIERAPDAGGSPGTWAQIATVDANVIPYSDTGVVVNTTYWYRMRAYSVLGESPYSTAASVIVPDGQLVKVMQWNIEGHLGRIANNNSAAAQAIARIVNYNQPAVLLFNEIDTQGLSAPINQAALIDWVTNNVPYLGTRPGVSFFVDVSSQSDGFERNAAISRYPILTPGTYNDGLRGLHSFTVRLSGANALQVFHAHLKCCSDDCPRKHFEAQFDADTIRAWAATNSIPYLFAGDWNDDEQNPLCAAPNTITTIRESGGLVEFKPTTLDGEYRTWSTTQTSIRFDYIYAATNRLAPSSGYVFSAIDWASHGLYTNTSPQNLVDDSQTASDHYCVFANYFFPDPHFTVVPTGAFASSGYQGGPFSPPNQLRTLSNVTSSSLSWVVTNSASWLIVSPTNGTLAAGASADITLSINSVANALPAGNYADAVSFRNATNGASVTVNANLAILLSPFQMWQVQYFGSTDNPAAAPDADPDGDGLTDLQEFLTGTDPTNSASSFHITSVVSTGNDVRVSWMMGSGKTNALQWTTGAGDGSYQTNTFASLFVVTNTVGPVTNYLDVGAATNSLPRYYRVRLVP